LSQNLDTLARHARMVLRELLTHEETLWLDAYHAHVANTLGPLLDNRTRAWLGDATRPLG
jgi:Xaa-Pro aminopeptidase